LHIRFLFSKKMKMSPLIAYAYIANLEATLFVGLGH